MEGRITPATGKVKKIHAHGSLPTSVLQNGHFDCRVWCFSLNCGINFISIQERLPQVLLTDQGKLPLEQ
jgi:hypothetical protein